MTTTVAAADPETAVLDRAHALALAIGESGAFHAFEAAQEALDADTTLMERLAAFQIREQELRLARAWGGADADEVAAMEREWNDLSSQPVLAAHLAARDELLALLREVGAQISEGVGLDFGEACSPAGGCC